MVSLRIHSLRMAASKKEILCQLQKEILPLQGFRPLAAGSVVDMGLGPIQAAFPNGSFPTGAVHELISQTVEEAAASWGFMAALASPLMRKGGVCIWVSYGRTLFPPALQRFGIKPDQVLFIDVKRERDVLWTIEEALKCEGLGAVVGEVREIDLTASRRLQLAVEQSRVTGFLFRHQPRNADPIASITRWRIKPLSSELEDLLPGVGFPRWDVELLKIRNGRPGRWRVEWNAGEFRIIRPEIDLIGGVLDAVSGEIASTDPVERRKTG